MDEEVRKQNASRNIEKFCKPISFYHFSFEEYLIFRGKDGEVSYYFAYIFRR